MKRKNLSLEEKAIVYENSLLRARTRKRKCELPVEAWEEINRAFQRGYMEARKEGE